MLILHKIPEFLSKYPKVKDFSKKNFQKTSLLVYRKQYKYQSSYTINKISINNVESFFGYYDKSPINFQNNNIIFHSSPFINTIYKPNPKIPIEIILKDLSDNSYHMIDRSFAYNWQQGSKLQWLSDGKFIFNNYSKGRFISKIFDAFSRKLTSILPYPIYDCHKDEYALTLNFSRLNLLAPDYGYRNISFDSLNDLDNDGIFYCDMKKKSKSLLTSLRNLIELKANKSFEKAFHSVNHIMINPKGDKFIFIHRWYSKNRQRFDRLLVYDIKASFIDILADSNKVSHCCWLNDNEIVGFLRNSEKSDRFFKIDIKTKKINIFSSTLMNLSDGHPSIYSDNMIFDSYPDRSRMKKLYKYNIKTKKLSKLGEFFEPIYYFGETRCDLHPRFSNDGKMIFFDSTHEGKRFLYSVNPQVLS